MKTILSILAVVSIAAALLAQSGKSTMTAYDTLGALLSANPPAKSEYVAVICGVAAKTDSDGFLLWYSPTATDDTNNAIFMPTNGIGRWFKIISSAGGGGTGVVSLTLTMPTGFSVQGNPGTNGSTITVATTVTNAVIKGVSGAIEAAIPVTDYVPSGLISTGGLTMDTAKILGRALNGGAVEQFGVGTGLLLSAGVLSGTFYVDVQMFTNAGSFTWTNPPNPVASYMYAVGAGEGGWAGYPIDTNNIGSLGTNANTGRGGNGGGVSEGWFFGLPDTIAVTVGQGGSPGTGANDYATNTVDAASGEASFIGDAIDSGYLIAWGGGTNQTCIIGCADGSGAGGTRGGYGGASGNDETLVNPGFGYGTNNATGGGGAGGLLGDRGAPAIANWSSLSLSTLGGIQGANGTNGISFGAFMAGYGGSGGGGSLTNNAGAGGNGGWPGGGGGGGGNAQVGFYSGYGGTGANGFVGIITIGFR